MSVLFCLGIGNRWVYEVYLPLDSLNIHRLVLKGFLFPQKRSADSAKILVVLLVGYIFFLYMKKSNIENNVSSGNFRVKDFFWLK